MRAVHRFSHSSQSGQVFPLALAVLVIACVTFFFVFNSGRAVNEKINLVNAADASAYSGAQIAARHLNFMAYTNRAMIANEAAIGHLYSFQVEVNMLGNIAQDAVNSISGTSLLGQLGRLILTAINPELPNYVEFLNQVIQPLVDSSKVFTGMLSLMLDANNATFTNFQEQAYMDLIQADPNTRQTVVDKAMSVVASSYLERASAPIYVNDYNETLSEFIAQSESQAVVAAANQANGGSAQHLCEMILFATPGAETGGSLGSSYSARAQNCQQALSGTGSLSLTIPGTPLAPEADGGLMIDAIRQSVAQMENATWIRDRNVDNYSIFGVFRADRAGSTQVGYNNGSINWVADNDTLRVKLLGIPFYSTSDGGSAAGNVDQARAMVDDLAIQGLRLFGLCTDDGAVDCNELANNQYDSIQRYAALDPNRQSVAVTAFLEQNNCSDHIGVDDEGNRREGWRDNLPMFEESVCNKSVYAIGQAEVYFQRPDCYEQGNASCFATDNGFSRLDGNLTEAPNLYNPFWHARLIATSVGDGNE
ncbi:MAG: Tad domain-containing protein [Pseudomonadota bacterium]|nr:Tad domain-containing protein [Pseudomonadota bacterium]